MARLLDTEQALQYVAMSNAKRAAKKRPTYNTGNKSEPLKKPENYPVLLSSGNMCPSYREFSNTIALYNRVSKVFKSRWHISMHQLNLLFAIECIQHAKGNEIPIAVSSVARNFCVAREHHNLFLNWLNQLSAIGLVSLKWTGILKGSTVKLTPIALNGLRELHEELQRVMKYYPERR